MDERVAATNFVPAAGNGVGQAPAPVGNSSSDFHDGQHVSYAVGRDASETSPGMLLTADRNIANANSTDTGNNGYGIPSNSVVSLGTNKSTDTIAWTTGKMHQNAGNVGLADGSVQQFSTSALKKQLGQTGDTGSVVIGLGGYNGNVLLFP
jgi:prepilin-type processing-associated H-X9-DG protein